MLTHLHRVAMKPARVVVLGAGGFIGGAISRRVAADGIPTIAMGRPELDLLAAGTAKRLAEALDPNDVLVFVSAKAPCRDLPMLRENLVMAQTVCSALRQRPVAHIVYISSDAVYKDSKEPLTEASCAEPGSLHGVMHLARELALRQDFAGPLTLIRPTLVYGADDPHNGYGPNRFRRLAAAGQDIVLFGEGEELRDHVNVDDIAELVRLVIVHRSCGIANAVSGAVVSFRELAEFVASEFTPYVAVRGSPRGGPMPHNGYRPFDNRAVLTAYPGFRFDSWREGLSRVHARLRAETKR
jgi:nucleoside-diphosphate-sugar epimerase